MIKLIDQILEETKVMTEAPGDYDITDALEQNAEDINNDIGAEDNTSSDKEPNKDEEKNTGDPEDVDTSTETTPEEDPVGNDDDVLDTGDETDTAGSEPEETVPKLQILTHLTPEQQQINNINILNNMKLLKGNCEDGINRLRKIPKSTAKESQIVDAVELSLAELSDKIHMYLIKNVSDSVETNRESYLTFLHEYKQAMKVIDGLCAVIAKSKEKDKD